MKFILLFLCLITNLIYADNNSTPETIFTTEIQNNYYPEKDFTKKNVKVIQVNDSN